MADETARQWTVLRPNPSRGHRARAATTTSVAAAKRDAWVGLVRGSRAAQYASKHLVRSLEQGDLLADGLAITAGDGLARRGDGALALLHCIPSKVSAADGALDLAEQVLDAGNQRFRLLLGGLEGLVRLALDHEVARVIGHLADLVRGQAALRRHLNGLRLTVLQVLGTDADDAVRVDLEGDLDFDVA